MRRYSVILILLALLLLAGCGSFGKVHTVAVLGKADTDEAVIVVTDVNGRQKSKKIKRLRRASFRFLMKPSKSTLKHIQTTWIALRNT